MSEQVPTKKMFRLEDIYCFRCWYLHRDCKCKGESE